MEEDKTVKSTFMENFLDSFKNILKDEDNAPPPLLNEKNTHDFKTEVFPISPLIEVDLFTKLDLETLFTIFYYQKNDYERFLAAKELKKREWRFNKKYLIWFKRNSQPKETTDVYEKGDFLIFDSEEKWTVKKSVDFIFEYKHLESEL